MVNPMSQNRPPDQCDCHDHEPTRRWRAMDLARSRCYLEYRPARVRCPEHGVLVAGAVGAPQVALHARLRELGRVPCGAVLHVRRRQDSAGRVAQRGRDLQARLRRDRGPEGRGQVRRPAQDRHRRNKLQEGPQVPHRRRRPRPGMPRLGARGLRQGGAEPLPRRAHPRAGEGHRGRHRRRRQVDKGAGQAPLPQLLMFTKK